MSGNRRRAIRMAIIAGAIVVLGGVGLACAGEDATAKGGVEARAVFARLKKLAGQWNVDFATTGKVAESRQEAEKHKDSHAAQPGVIFKLTGAGSALVETQMPGKPHEMVSVYHLDGDELRMAHDCAAGNQPRLKLDRAKSTPDHLVFVFDGGSNLNPAKDMHIHGLEITFHEDGRVVSDWEGYMGGKSVATTSFIMTRSGHQAPVPGRATAPCAFAVSLRPSEAASDIRLRTRDQGPGTKDR